MAALSSSDGQFEPNYLIPDVEKYHVEDLILVTEGAPRVLSRMTDWSRLLTPGA